jgi:hypothetical protein
MRKPVLRTSKSLLNRRRRHLFNKRTDSLYLKGGRAGLLGERELELSLGRLTGDTPATFVNKKDATFSETKGAIPIHLTIDIIL